jgi:hypothetical protein
MESIKSLPQYDGMAWGGGSLLHQRHDFPSHVTELLLSVSPMSGLVK